MQLPKLYPRSIQKVFQQVFLQVAISHKVSNNRVHLGKVLNIPYINDKLNNVGLSEKELKNLSYHQCHLLNNNPVLVARHFQYEVEEITLDGPLGKILCYTHLISRQV